MKHFINFSEKGNKGVYMYNLSIEGTKNTPTINFDASMKVLEIYGDSIPEDPYEFYMPLFHWLEIVEDNPLKKLTVDVKLEYFNTSSSKCILDILKRFEEIHNNKNTEVTINWYYMTNDEDMGDIGEEYMNMLKLPFNLLTYE
jgi:hypothetical protein